MIIFHGSNTVVESPIIQAIGYNKDFGFGFYCTNMEHQAIRWAAIKRPHKIINCYDYITTPELATLHFSQMNEEWLDFVVACRKGFTHSYDIVEGPMADDTVWDHIEEFLAGGITREAFWVLVKFKYPTHQIVFCTNKALQTISFKNSYQL